MLRFEDTDKERSSRAFEDSILEDLLWLGIEPDGDVSRQTGRLARYGEVLSQLVCAGLAYPCFCSAESDAGSHAPYPGTCRNIPAEEKAAKIASGENFCVRFALPDDSRLVTFHDRLRGEMVFDVRSGGDFVISRADGTPTYTFAVVVDDHDFQVTQVIRGEEHISNTPRQEMVSRALRWESPEWIHIPMVLDAERHKLSKRSGAVSISSYREDGWSPEALVSYMATLSWSRAPADRAFLPAELAPLFDLDSVALDSPVHDPERMRHFGRLAMKSAPRGGLLSELLCLFPSFDESPGAAADREALVGELLPECACRSELADSLAAALSPPAAGGEPNLPSWTGDLIGELTSIAPEEWHSSSIKKILKNFQKEEALEGKIFYHAIRAALTGKDHGAPIALLMACLGRKIVFERLAD
jgi:glutamyl-tRNA synthetase